MAPKILGMICFQLFMEILWKVARIIRVVLRLMLKQLVLFQLTQFKLIHLKLVQQFNFIM